MSSESWVKFPKTKSASLRQHATFFMVCLALFGSGCARSVDKGIYHDEDSAAIAKHCSTYQHLVFINDRIHGASSSKNVSVFPDTIRNNSRLLDCLEKRTKAAGMVFSILGSTE